MKRFLLLAIAALVFVGCNEMFEDEGNSSLALSELPTLTAGFEDADTRTYVESNKYLRWHEGDLISVFVGNTQNCQYCFLGATGANSGEFEPVESDNLGTGNALDRIYAVYPYDAEATISDLGVISYSIPVTQTYAEASFGRGANVMVAATESLDDRFLGFKNACGYLKIKLHGGGVVTSIKLKGNNGEKIAGNATITATYGGVPDIDMLDDATDSIILDCGDGVELSADAENPTVFWVVVPPTTFDSGITITVTNTDGGVFEQTTTNVVAIERNMIQPMAAIEALEFEIAKPANNKIWYTATEKVEPDRSDVFGATLLSNIYDPTTKEGVLTFDSDVTQIGNSAFFDCVSLTSVTIPDSVTTIGDEAFEYCDSLTSVTIPDSVTTIGREAFYGCESLTSVTIPDSVTTIGDWAFASCNSLTSVTIPDSVTTLGDGAFAGCLLIKEFKGKFAEENGRCLIVDNTLIAYAYASGTEYTIPNSVTTIGDYTFRYCNSLTSITIGDSVTTIGDHAFYGCDSLTSVTIGDSVTTIGPYAFSGCDSLTSVTIGDSVTTIGPYAFNWCKSLTSVTIGDSVTTIGEHAFNSCESLTSITIPNSVTTIGDGAFAGCRSLTSVTIPDNVTTIGDGAFNSCESLTSITIPDSVITIGDYTFAHCSNLTSITIPDSVTTIGECAFYYCDSLTSVTIPDSVTTIGRAAFDCYILTSVYCKPTTPPTIRGNVFGFTPAIYVPTASVDAYKDDEGWFWYWNAIYGYDF